MRTLAVIIGNNNYHEGAKLTNANNDAICIKQVFERLGYDIIDKLDCSSSDYIDILSEYEERIKDYDATIFYYAGHGFELDGENYLPAIDCQIPPANKYEAGRFSIRITELLDIYINNSNKVNIVIIDACRQAFERSGNVALAPMFAPKGTLLAFSTSPNEGASDFGFEGNSIYTGSILKYLGREHLSVEDLFKKVRKTVYALSEGRKTTWEHTSLINDFYFNTGQLVHSLELPYSSNVIKDINYSEATEFGILISQIKTYNWYVQNPAIYEILQIESLDLDKNQQFILGRNILQASGAATAAQEFIYQIQSKISEYTHNKENHLLNGILFEIYFNSYGEFRQHNTKKHYLDRVLNLRKDLKLEKSFNFISSLISNTGYSLIYLPESIDKFIDINVLATLEKHQDHFGNEVEFHIINSIIYNGLNITKMVKNYNVSGMNQEGLKEALSIFFTAPIELIQIICPIKLNNIAFVKSTTLEDEF